MTPPATANRLDTLLAHAAARHPARAAVQEGDSVLTYAGLEQAVRELADALTAAGVRPGDRIGVFLPKSTDAVIAVNAVLRSGAVVAPLDVWCPPERAARMVENAGITALLTAPDTARSAARIRERTGHGPAPGAELPGGLNLMSVAGPVRSLPAASDGGYLLFTSGSTGWPKGVLLSHENVLHFVRWAVEELGVTCSDRIGSQAALTFDLSTFDLFGSALSAARLVLLPEALKAFPHDVVDWLRSERISVLYAVPTLYQSLLHKGGIGTAPPPDLRILAFAGEPFPAADLERYVGVFPSSRFYNLYGPTETNVCTFERLRPGWSARDALPIGRAIPGVQVELVDREGRATAAEGEIAVMGPTVFRGYLQAGELRRRTVPVTLHDGSTREAYLTGDLGRYGADGRIHLRGRRDHQVKRRGYRIDLLDIESVVGELPAVQACAAVWSGRKDGDGRIHLYVVLDGAAAGSAAAGSAAEEQVRGAVARALPRHMVPDELHTVDRLRLTDRGKIDRESLATAAPKASVTPNEGRDHG